MKNLDIVLDNCSVVAALLRNKGIIQIENGISINGFVDAKKKVPDVIRYIAVVKSNKLSFICNNVTTNIKESMFNDILPINGCERSIVVVLESPHKNEYIVTSQGELKPISPAQSKTGKSFDYFKSFFIDNIISSLNTIPDGVYCVVLCNPVQYQTSLHYLLGKSINAKITKDFKVRDLRKLVWHAIWDSVDNDFIGRLKKYNPSVVINCCTNDFKDTVSDSLNVDFCVVCASHPSSWNEFHIKMNKS